MSVIWSGVTEEGAVVPVQVTDEGKVVAVGDGPQGDYLPTSGGNLTGDLTLGTDKITLSVDGSATFASTTLVSLSGNPPQNGDTGGSLNASGQLFLTTPNLSDAALQVRSGDSTARAEIKGDGSAEFAGAVVGKGSGPAYAFEVTDGITNMGGLYRDSTGANLYLKNISGATKCSLKAEDGSATFAGPIIAGGSPEAGASPGVKISNGGAVVAAKPDTGNVLADQIWLGYASPTNNITSYILSSGAAFFSGDVIIGSRGEKWLIRESNGVAMLVQQSREAVPMPGVSPVIPEKVRDIPAELDLIEMALNEVMEKLRMTPPAGWPVWDGSDNP